MRCRSAELKDQLTLLRETKWDVLVILDACRADAFLSVTGRGEAVRSAGNCTAAWIARAGPFLAEIDALVFTANPVWDREIETRVLGLEMVSVWKRHWSLWTPLRIPGVHPASVSAVVETYYRLHACGPSDRPAVVVYGQPHSPFIGDVPLRTARWGLGGEEFHRACHALPRPDKEVAAGRTSWPEVREAYLANLRLAWESALRLAAALEGRRIVVTSDHGELLGEHGGQFGHEVNWLFGELLAVPWLELGPDDAGGQPTTQQKLEALGYA